MSTMSTMSTIKFLYPIKDGSIEIENAEGQLRITIPGAPEHTGTCNRIYVERIEGGFYIRSHNDEGGEGGFEIMD